MMSEFHLQSFMCKLFFIIPPARFLPEGTPTFWKNVNKIRLIFQIIYKKHAPWTANCQFLAKSLTTSITNVLEGLHEKKHD